jgi:peptidoglycan/xylan/chitin deacetylase (PgdA/CDA1 family)
MLFPTGLCARNSDSPPDQALCLTFDDGPGEHTADISAYLREEGISATFFLIGGLVQVRPGVVEQLLDDGHSIGNHTQNHPDLAKLDESDVAQEIREAHGALIPFLKRQRQRPHFFRAPSGSWKYPPKINECLCHGERLGEIYQGPVHWDYSGDDWLHWQRAESGEDDRALNAAVASYAPADGGIVLMHDNNHESDLANKNQTYRMIRQLIPMWKSRGCTFMPLEEINKSRRLRER